jgi:hypothetical protein
MVVDPYRGGKDPSAAISFSLARQCTPHPDPTTLPSGQIVILNIRAKSIEENKFKVLLKL